MFSNGAPGRIRTFDQRLRRALLYPAELRAHRKLHSLPVSYSIIKIKEVEERDQVRNFQPPISGELIMETFQLKPCREIGQIKEAIKEAILEGVIPNEYEASYQFMLEKGISIGLKKG